MQMMDGRKGMERRRRRIRAGFGFYERGIKREQMNVVTGLSVRHSYKVMS